jgi:hypothetical protein
MAVVVLPSGTSLAAARPHRPVRFTGEEATELEAEPPHIALDAVAPHPLGGPDVP